MIFRQLFKPQSNTYTCLLGCGDNRQAVLIEPVIASMKRYLDQLRSLAFSLDTPIHADHVTAALERRHKVGSQIAAQTLIGNFSRGIKSIV